MITNHKLDGADYVPTVHTSGWIKPDLILVHDTSSRLTKGNVVNYLKKNKPKVSYHVVIERDGTIVQMAPFNRRCHHAGRSSYKGRKWCNGFSVGIGIVNPGPLQGTAEKAKSWFGEWYSENIVEKRSPHHGSSHLWLAYTPEQMMALDEVVNGLREAYGDIPVSGHYVVSPGRKVDPAPTLRLSDVGGEDVELEAPIAPAEPAEKVLVKTSRKYKTTAATKHAVGGMTVVGIGAEIAKVASIDKITAVKSYLDVVSGFISSYGIPMLIGAGIVGWLVTEYLLKWQREDYDAGRYEPSAELNEGGGDWL